MKRDFGCWTLDFGRWTLDIGRWTLDVGRWTLDIGRWTLDVGRWTLDVGLWMLDIGRWTLDIGRWTLDFGRWTLDFGRWTLDRGQWICLTLAFTLGALWGCQSNHSEQPSISDAKTARIMADISIADAATTGLAGYAKDSLMQVYFKQVFEMHGVTLESYEKDLRILAQDLPRMEAIVKKADELLSGTGKIKDGGVEN